MASNAAKRVLVVEDDRAIADLIKHHFAKESFTVTTTPSGEEALVLVEEIRPALLILDWMIEDVSGIEVCRRLRRSRVHNRMPILMLTARGEEEDRIRGLETGADDFITKPFSPKELIARAKALLRRASPNLLAEKLGYAGIEMDVSAHRVRRDGTPVSLGPTEYRLLRHFLQNPEKVFSRQQLLDLVWQHSEEIELRTVDVHIRRLRKALETAGSDDVIRTVRSEGYSLDANA
ncbi:phosphate regulon transcriptional regulator PhoB [Sphingomonas sabuli]|uniref:Phosphate regulon transcriptional regulatory protein PhoB n=1 Tax=Sphingomonas sabuli TaxID=2764186 RepID=A0A7G9L2F4_9SPHN|nr:phosphate regulon transcriptional regulator PhoB [Sphingomonas sabuli]QNM82803.1 phosphate regulon transcriptional regulator PhoB [Sphingomonas sabuli]